MKKVETVDFHAFMKGKVVSYQRMKTEHAIVDGFVLATTLSPLLLFEPQTVDAETIHTDDTTVFESGATDTSWADQLIPMLKHQGLPLAVTMGVWAALEMIINRPASAIERLKWAIMGYLALQFIPGFIRGIGHHYHDDSNTW